MGIVYFLSYKYKNSTNDAIFLFTSTKLMLERCFQFSKLLLIRRYPFLLFLFSSIYSLQYNLYIKNIMFTYDFFIDHKYNNLTTNHWFNWRKNFSLVFYLSLLLFFLNAWFRSYNYSVNHYLSYALFILIIV